MECERAQRMIEVYADGELDVSSTLQLEEHLAGCPHCAECVQGLKEERRLLKEKLPPHSVLPELHNRIQHALRAERSGARPAHARAIFVRWAALAAAAAGFLVGGFFLGNRQHGRDQFVDELVADHLRSLQPGHLTDVASSDRHNVKPWFSGRIEYAPTVPDLSAEGFPLTGGRIDRLDKRTVAALVYQRRLHVINVFVLVGETIPPGITRSEKGYNLRSWTKGDLSYYAVSDLAGDELNQFVALMQR